jgi:membrane protein YdbS with pleckstrin-like domain
VETDTQPGNDADRRLPPPLPATAISPSNQLLGPDLSGFTSLDRRVIQLWRIGGVIGYGIASIPVLVGMLLASEALLGQAIVAFVPWSALVVLVGVWVVWHTRRAYQAWGYRIDDRVLVIRSGVWFRVVRLLPLSRLQHVDLHRGPLERAHGLASLTLHTAGTREASIGIPGLADADAEQLRDRLVAAGGDDAV